jgi:CubicO group peptidase (beta-lactamase class C family)
MKKSKRIFLIVGIVFGILVIGFLMLPNYAQKALIYLKPGIEDYPIFENRTVAAGIGQEWPIDSLLNQLKIDDETLAKMEVYEPVSFLVVKDGKIIFEKYWEEYGPETLSNSFSMSKSIVGLLVGAAIDDGYIKSIEQPVSDFIPEFRNEKNRDLKIKDVLTMSSGLNWNESYASLFSTTTNAYYGNNINELIYKLEVTEKPGVSFNYLSGNTQLLAMLVEAATNRKISEYVSGKFWKPMGAINDALWCLDDENGMEKAYCCFNSNARDFARWGQLILNNGTWNGDTLISSDYIQASIHAADLTDETGNKINYYGYQWWIHDANGWEVPYMRGILGQYVFVIPEENAVVVRLGHKRSDEKKNHHPIDSYLYLETAKKLLDEYNRITN